MGVETNAKLQQATVSAASYGTVSALGTSTAAAAAASVGISGAALGMVAGPIGALVGLAVASLLPTPGHEHGRGTESRAKNEAKFVKAKLKQPLATNVEQAINFVEFTTRPSAIDQKKWEKSAWGTLCTVHTKDRMSCVEHIGLYAKVIDQQRSELLAKGELGEDVSMFDYGGGYGGVFNSLSSSVPSAGSTKPVAGIGGVITELAKVAGGVGASYLDAKARKAEADAAKKIAAAAAKASTVTAQPVVAGQTGTVPAPAQAGTDIGAWLTGFLAATPQRIAQEQAAVAPGGAPVSVTVAGPTAPGNAGGIDPMMLLLGVGALVLLRR